MKLEQGMRQMAVSAKIIRADGTVEDLGVVSYESADPLQRAKFALKKKLGMKNRLTDFFGTEVDTAEGSDG